MIRHGDLDAARRRSIRGLGPPTCAYRQLSRGDAVERARGSPPERAGSRIALVVLVGAVALGTALGFGRSGTATPFAALDPPQFVEEAAAAGIEHRYDGEFTFFVGGGVAAFDCDDDARPDLYFAGGAEPAALYRNDSPVGGALRFTPMADPITDLTDVTGAYPLDVDGDRHTDLVVLRVGENVILRGLGDCRFERANEELGFDGGDAWTAAFSATWEGNAALPTLAIGNYLVLDDDGQQTFECHDNELVRPDTEGDGMRADRALAGWCSLRCVRDWDRRVAATCASRGRPPLLPRRRFSSGGGGGCAATPLDLASMERLILHGIASIPYRDGYPDVTSHQAATTPDS